MTLTKHQMLNNHKLETPAGTALLLKNLQNLCG